MYLRGSAGLQAGSTAVICVGHKPLEYEHLRVLFSILGLRASLEW